VGEPWNSVAVERGVGTIVLATAQIWRRGVEKVLAMREPVMEQRRAEVEALVCAAPCGAAFRRSRGLASPCRDSRAA
jgi:ABC-type nitrate/sulfonate/bicarbonate transport system substrate-binding protein